MYIVFEGIDGCGKTTQLNLLKEKLAHTKPNVISEPYNRELIKNNTKKGSNDRYQQALLYAVDRLQYQQSIKDARVTISDRSFYSSMVYQSENEKEREWIYEINRKAIKPDIVIYLKIPVDLALLRRPENNDLETKIQLVNADYGYDELFKPYITIYHNHVIKIDATQSIEEVHEDVLTGLTDYGLIL